MDHRMVSEVTRELALKEGVCIHPVLHRVTDLQTGTATTVVMPCRATRDSRCPSCAAAARRVRIQQCTEGWHLDREPEPPTHNDSDDEDGDDEDLDEDDDALEDDEGEDVSRRTRSTRRRSDAPDLPVKHVQDRTIGATFEGTNGRRYRPSMFVTLTLPSYGRILPGRGVPADPEEYDYRTAALDAMHFTKLLDRWIQNLRRCAGYKVQYFGAIEAQRRLAPHLHVALRGAIPRQVIRQVTRATYTQIWWPPIDHETYTPETGFPEWDGIDYLDPATREPLPTWDEAMRELDADPDAKPVHTIGFGRQVDIKGLLGGTPDADRTVRYLTKYLTKSIADTYTQPDVYDAAYDGHIERLHEQVQVLPCSPACSNWLRYGIQPKNAGPGLTPGLCASNAHSREDLGLGGRRVQVSRGWSTKTLAQHRAERADVVRQVLQAAGYTPPDADRMSTQTLTDTGLPRYQWHTHAIPPEQATTAILHAITERRRWRAEYEHAKQVATGSDPPVDERSATVTT